MPASSSQLKFFLDRSLGKQVAQLLRAAEFDLITLGEYYGEQEGQRVQDKAWLQLCGENGWPVLTADTQIKYKASEKKGLDRLQSTAFRVAVKERFDCRRGGSEIHCTQRRHRKEMCRRRSVCCFSDTKKSADA